MTEQPPFRRGPTPPALWWWGQPLLPAPANRQVRIGDAERDRAVAALGDHFAAGRLTKEELDERIDRAMVARFESDLQPLFDDLPDATPAAARPGPRQLVPSGPPLFAVLLPVLVFLALVVLSGVFHAPFMFFGFLWLAMLGGFWGRSHRHRSRR